MSPMTREQMSAMAHAMRKAWEEAATERPAISFLFEDDAPYLTIWDDNRCKCTHGRILKNVYNVQGHRRMAQAFVCTIPGESDEEGIDVVNVHAPSGIPKLTDAQRFELTGNLLQSNSMTRANRPIGEGRFLIGGDMNTDEVPLGQILDKLRRQGILKTTVEVMVPLNGQHGDICVVGGFTTTMVREIARNHDKQHVPYGIAWRKQPQHATEQLTTTPRTQNPTAPDTTTTSRATGATAAAVPTGRTPKHTQPDPQVVAVRPERQLSQLPLEKASASAWPATEQPGELIETVTARPAAVPTGKTPKQTQPDPQVDAERPERQLSQLPLEKASASAWPAIEQPDELIETETAEHRPEASVVRTEADAEITQNTTEPPTQKGPDHIGATKPQTEVSCDADTGTTRHATEQSHTDEHEPPELNGPGQEMSYVIVNAFLDNVTFESTEAERLIKRVILMTGEVIRANMLFNIDEVFQPIFFYYPNGPDDRTRGEPRNAMQYIRQWRDIAAWRQMAGAGAQQHATEQLAKPQVQSILHQYIDNFIRNEADDTQRTQSWNKNKSRAEAVLRRLCGSAMMAKVIWQVGLPNISEARCAMEKVLPATEQQRPLKQDVRDSIATATKTILNWLGMLANSIQEHKATPTYQEHARKSGTQKNKSGLTEIELSMKEEKKRAARLKYGCQPSTASGSDTWQTPARRQWHADTRQAPAQWQWHGDT